MTRPARVLTFGSLLGLAVLLAACSDDTTEPPQPVNQLTGIVTDTEGNPIADAGILMVYELPETNNRPSTGIYFSLPETTQVLAAIFSDGYQDTVRTLADGLLPPGQHEFNWDGRDSEGLIAPSGVFHYVLIMGEHVSDAAFSILHSDYPADTDPTAYHFLTRTDTDGTFVLEQGPRNFDYPFNMYDEEGNLTGIWTISRNVRFFALADGYLAGHSGWAYADPDSGCAVEMEMAPVRR